LAVLEYGHWQRYGQPQPTVLLVPTLVDHPLPALGSDLMLLRVCAAGGAWVALAGRVSG
jgi:hypothetical protein